MNGMGIGPAWLLLGCIWWTLIVFSLVTAGVCARKGRKLVVVTTLTTIEGAAVAVTGLFPWTAVTVFWPIVLVMLIPVHVACGLLGLDC